MNNPTTTFEQALESNGSIVYTNVGVSMRPLIREGLDVMRIKKADGKIKKYDVVLYRRPGVSGRGHYVLHRVLKVGRDSSYWIVGDNCTDGENVKSENVIGVLDSVIRGGKKTVRTTDLSYRLYVAFWCAPYRIRFFVLRSRRFAARVKNKLRRVLMGKKDEV